MDKQTRTCGGSRPRPSPARTPAVPRGSHRGCSPSSRSAFCRDRGVCGHPGKHAERAARRPVLAGTGCIHALRCVGPLGARAGGYALRRARHEPPPGAGTGIAPTPDPLEPVQVSNLPPRNRFFTGRENLFATIALRFGDTPPAPVPVGQVLYGLGGVGKTQLALEYAHRHRGDYDVVWWVAAEQGTSVAAELAALARRLDVAEVAGQADMIDSLWDVLHGDVRWLLIFDNVEHRGDLEPYWPAIGGHVLVTSRDPNWAGLAQTLEVGVLDRAESITFLRSRVGSDAEATGDLADALDNLPLALEQAAAYVGQTKMTVDEYARLVRDRLPDALHRGEPFAYKKPVATTWSIALDELSASAPAAAELLTLCAMLAPEDIPRDLPTRHAAELPDRLREVVADPFAYADAVGALVGFSLVSVRNEALGVHRLVQAVVRERAGSAGELSWAARALRLSRRSSPLPVGSRTSWPGCERLLPHALAVAGHAERLGARSPTAPPSCSRREAATWPSGSGCRMRPAPSNVRLPSTNPGTARSTRRSPSTSATSRRWRSQRENCMRPGDTWSGRSRSPRPPTGRITRRSPRRATAWGGPCRTSASGRRLGPSWRVRWRSPYGSLAAPPPRRRGAQHTRRGAQGPGRPLRCPGSAGAGTRRRRGGARSGRPGGRVDPRQPRPNSAGDGRDRRGPPGARQALDIDAERRQCRTIPGSRST